MRNGFDETVKSAKTDALIDVIKNHFPNPPKRILVVGCGSGAEAGRLARAFSAEVIGIDIGAEFTFDHAAAAPAMLMEMDAQSLQFTDQSFDFIFSFHALEHIPDPIRALSEMARVLMPGGGYVIGTPNKSRLIGHIGSPHPLHKKILWNLADLWMMATGRWSNEQGAHAGFSREALQTMCETAFGATHNISDDYYRRLYRNRAQLIESIIASRFKKRIFPCLYFAGTKRMA